ncbi:hypothetical protein PTTG_27264 [Puccinia triticina 1-1 BBBD Race 1]|uniref:Dynein heavy chain tail domain-containing protein n=1 Tax=Puccinia triticina (isolate 1-1 / race 1 (BBBD)) TaxID=630390 RepID=A0A180GLP4_PUCT1|nr:hypothetical protein PTTG_27264 [Puccinia triticina 1-1 BBBD Race 1]
MHIFQPRVVFLIICGLGALESVESVGNTPGVSATELRQTINKEEITNTAPPVGSLPRGGQLGGTLKRTREIVPGSTTDLRPSCKQSLEEIRDSHYKTISNWMRWDSMLSRIHRGASKEKELESVVKNYMIPLISSLFQNRIKELEADSKGLPAGTTSQSSYEGRLEHMIDIYKIWALYHEDANQTSRMKEGCDLLMDFFVDVQKYQIIPNDQLSIFLNGGKGKELVLTYVMGRFPAGQNNLVPYLNLNLKQSLEKGPSTRKMSDLLKLLNKDTWKHIEFDYLKAQLSKKEQIAASISPDLVQIKSIFLEKASPHMKLSMAEVEELLEKLMTCISKIKVSRQDYRFYEGYYSQFKDLYNMMTFLVDTNRDKISVEFIKNSKNFRRMHAFEETAGLISSVMHCLHIRLEGLQKNQRHKPEIDVLADMNENWKSVRFQARDFGKTIENKFPNLEKSSQLLEFVEAKMKPVSSGELLAPEDKTRVEYSVQKSKYQLKRLWVSLSMLKDEANEFEQTFSQSLRILALYPFTVVSEMEKKWGRKIEVHKALKNIRNNIDEVDQPSTISTLTSL